MALLATGPAVLSLPPPAPLPRVRKPWRAVAPAGAGSAGAPIVDAVSTGEQVDVAADAVVSHVLARMGRVRLL